MSETDSRDDLYGNYNFLVEIDGITVGGFAEVSGLATEVDIIEYRNGDEPARVRKIPGLKKYANIVLKRGITSNKELWEWHKRILDGQTDRRAGSIVLLDENREEVLRFKFDQAWPVKWTGTPLSARGNAIAIETLELAVETIELIS